MRNMFSTTMIKRDMMVSHCRNSFSRSCPHHSAFAQHGTIGSTTDRRSHGRSARTLRLHRQQANVIKVLSLMSEAAPMSEQDGTQPATKPRRSRQTSQQNGIQTKTRQRPANDD